MSSATTHPRPKQSVFDSIPALARENPMPAGPPLDTNRISCHIPIPEEDESNNETGSESLEPITPTDVQFQHSFKHHDAAVDSQSPTNASTMPEGPQFKDANPLSVLAMLDSRPKPTPRPTTTSMKSQNGNVLDALNALEGARPKPTPRATAASTNSASSSDVTSPTTKNGLGKLVGSVRNKLHRQSSNKPEMSINTNVPRMNITPASAVLPRRLSSWSIKNSPRSSASNSPPSPGSPVNDSTEPRGMSIDGQVQPRNPHKHSKSSNSLSRMSSAGQRSNKGVTWAFGGKNSKNKPPRRRSASTELVPKLSQDSDDPTIGLIDTFSKHAAEGVGMKARRLSTSLPDEFNVDHCELTKEFKSTSLVPGKRGRRLGVGATAEVRIMSKKGWHEDLVAVKEYRLREKDEGEDEYLKKIQSEFSIAKALHHPNIVTTVRLCTHHGRWNHVMEFCNHGELYTLVERGLFKTHYRQEDRFCMFKQLLRAVGYLHANGIAHRDIKPENVLMDKEGHLKLSDFGVSEVFSGEHPGLRASGGQCGVNMGEVRRCAPGICGSLPYIAPEVMAKEVDYDPRPYDVWSCAIVYVTMTFGGSPWQAAKTDNQHYMRFRTGWDKWLETHPDGEITAEADGTPKCGPLFAKLEPPSLRRLILKMLHPIPEKRISMRDVLQSNFVQNIECCTPENYDEQRGTINAKDKASSKAASKYVLKKHHHIPPKEISKFRQNLTHRFDMGEG